MSASEPIPIEKARRWQAVKVNAGAASAQEAADPPPAIPIRFGLDMADIGCSVVEGEARVTAPGGLLLDANMRVLPALTPKEARHVAERMLSAARAADCDLCMAVIRQAFEGQVTQITCPHEPSTK